MAEQARTLVALHASDPAWAALLDQPRSEADAALHASARYEQVGVDVGNGWQRQENGGLWGSDWFGRAQAAVVYILVNDWHEAIYLIRAPTRTAPARRHPRLPLTSPRTRCRRSRSSDRFWSLTMYDKDYFMLRRAVRPHQYRHRQPRR